MEITIEAILAAFFDEDVVEAGVGSALVPIKKWTVFGMMVSPKVALLCFASTSARLKVADGCFVDFEVVAGAKLGGDELVERLKSRREVIMPGTHDVAGEFDAMGCSQSPFLSVEGLVVAKFFSEKVRPK